MPRHSDAPSTDGRPRGAHPVRRAPLRLLAATVAIGAVVAVSCAPAATRKGPPDTTPPRSSAPAPGVVSPVQRPGTYVTAGERRGVGGCPMFPRDHAFHASIRSLPVRADSSAAIGAVGRERSIMAGFGSTVWMGSRLGIPVNVVDGSTATWQRLLLSHLYTDTSDGDWMPWPAVPRFEGWPGSAWDRHLVVVDSDTCRSWEAIQVQPPWENLWAGVLGRWWADKVVSIDLMSNDPRPQGTVTAAGFSMLAGLVSFDDVAAGDIDHAIGMSLPEIRPTEVVWPAQATDGRSTHPAAPQMGSWFRLKSTADLSGLGPQAKVVARALQDHGAIAGDTGPNISLGGQPDTRWDDQDLAGLARFTLADFEIVDASPMKVSDSSFRIR